MVEISTSKSKCSIVLDKEISDEDIKMLQAVFMKKYHLYIIDLLVTYSLKGSLVIFLYKQIYLLKKNVEINIGKHRLSKYFHQLGFSTNFISTLASKQIKNPNPSVFVIGGSANSSQKIIDILSRMNTLKFTTFIIQHINSKSTPIFDSILSQHVEAQVIYAKDKMRVKPSTIYIAPANKHLEVCDNTIFLNNLKQVNYARPSISVSFDALSKHYKEKAIFLLECGHGEDGVDSLYGVRQNNATVLIQDSSQCKAKSIPLSAYKSREYDYKLNVENIIEYMKIMSMSFENKYQLITYLFDAIYKKYEYDFRSYQKEYVQRRLFIFMIKHNIKDLKVAMVLILFYKPAFKSLFLDLSINVTEFFRDEKSLNRICQILKNEYINTHKIKIWSAGCSNGKEVYSMGIILKQLGLFEKSLIYATDFNPVVIQEAKNGIYPLKYFHKAKQNYEKLGFNNILDEYFDMNDKFVQIKENIKKNILFFTHNLEKDSVFNEFDIIECKNVLIYFNDILKIKILDLLYESLKFGGYLALGASELLPMEFYDRFNKFDEQYNIYKKVA